ncbi:hypothetical protein EZS27_028379, partial [termite gut metagenome]
MRDIGYHFPDTAEEFKNIDSNPIFVIAVWFVSYFMD